MVSMLLLGGGFVQTQEDEHRVFFCSDCQAKKFQALSPVMLRGKSIPALILTIGVFEWFLRDQYALGEV